MISNGLVFKSFNMKYLQTDFLKLVLANENISRHQSLLEIYQKCIGLSHKW